MHTVLVIFYQNCTIMSKTCGTFILFLFYANANVETRHVVTVQDTALTSFYNQAYYLTIKSIASEAQFILLVTLLRLLV